MLEDQGIAFPEARMQNSERKSNRFENRLDQMEVPGLIQIIEDFRRAYPQLSLDVIRWVLRQPPESKNGGESPAEV